MTDVTGVPALVTSRAAGGTPTGGLSAGGVGAHPTSRGGAGQLHTSRQQTGAGAPANTIGGVGLPGTISGTAAHPVARGAVGTPAAGVNVVGAGAGSTVSGPDGFVFAVGPFPTRVLGIQAEILLNGAWQEISPYIYQRSDIVLSNVGRADETTTIQASQMTLVLNNRDGRFTPKNPNGVYYPYITRNTQIRLLVNSESSTLFKYAGYRFWGEITEWPVAWDHTGVDVYLSVTASGIWRRISQTTTTLGSPYRRYHQLGLTGTSVPQAYWSMEDGSGSLNFVQTLPPGGGNNGTWTSTGTAAPGLASNATFPGSNALPTLNGTAFDFTVPAAAPTPVVLQEGAANPNSITSWLGQKTIQGTCLIATIVSNSATAPIVKCGPKNNTSKYTMTKAVYTTGHNGDYTGVYYLPSNAGGIQVITSPAAYDVGYLEVSNLAASPAISTTTNGSSINVTGGNCARPGGGTFAVTLAAYDITNNAVPFPSGLSGDHINSWYGQQCYTTGPGQATWAWPTRTYDACAVSFTGVPTTSPAGNTTRFLLSVPAGGDTASGTTNWNVAEVDTLGTVAKFEVYLNWTGTLLVQGRNTGGGVIFAATTATNVQNNPVMVSLELLPSGNSIDWAVRLIRPGDNTVLESKTGRVAGTVSRVTGVSFGRAETLVDTAVGHLTVIYGAVPSLVAEATAMFGYKGEYAMTRFGRLCDELNIDYETIGVTATTQQLGPQVDATQVAAFQAIEDSDGGLLFETRDQFGLGYRSLVSLQNQTPAVTLSYTAATLTGSLVPTYDDQHIRNDVTVTNYDGYTHRVQLAAGANSIQLPPEGVGTGYATTRAVNLAVDSQVPVIAAHLLAVGAVDEPRIPSVTVDMSRLEVAGLFSVIPALRAGDYLQITNPPSFLTSSVIKQLVWGYTETLNAFTWTFSYNCIPETPWESSYTPGDVSATQLPGSAPATPASATPQSAIELVSGGLRNSPALSAAVNNVSPTPTLTTIGPVPPTYPVQGAIWFDPAHGLQPQEYVGSGWTPYSFGLNTTADNAMVSALIVTGLVTAAGVSDGTTTPAMITAAATALGDTLAAGTISGAEVEAFTSAASQLTAGFVTARSLGGSSTTVSVNAPTAPHRDDMWINPVTGVISRWDGVTWQALLFDGTAAVQAGSVTSASIAAETILAGNIAAGTITSGLMAAGIVVAGIVDTTTLTASTLLIYSGEPGPGSLVGSFASAPGADNYGNSYPVGVESTQGTFTGVSIGHAGIVDSDISGGAISNVPISAPTITGGTITESAITFDQNGGVLRAYLSVTTTIKLTVADGPTWTAPAGSYSSAEVHCWGADAGGGGGDTTYGGGGGGGGAYSGEYSYPIVPGNVYNILVGAAGAGGQTNSPGTGGGATLFDNGGVIANGGDAGVDHAGGLGGAASVAHYGNSFPGGAGGPGGLYAASAGGGGRAGSAGPGGAGSPPTGDSSPGYGGAAGAGSYGIVGSNGVLPLVNGNGGWAGGSGAGRGGAGTTYQTQYYDSVGTQSYYGNGSPKPGGLLWQGYYSGNGDQYSYANYDYGQIAADWSGWVIDSVTLTINCLHSWYSTGMYMVLSYSWSGDHYTGHSYWTPQGQTSIIDVTAPLKSHITGGLAALKFGPSGLTGNATSKYNYGYYQGGVGEGSPRLAVTGHQGTGGTYRGGDGSDGYIYVVYTSTSLLASAVSPIAGTDQFGSTYGSGVTGTVQAFHPGANPATLETWQPITFTGNWYVRPGYNARYKLVAESRQLRIEISANYSGTVSGNSTLTTAIPTGYHPSAGQPITITWFSSGTPTAAPAAELSPGGVITCYNLPTGTSLVQINTIVSLD